MGARGEGGREKEAIVDESGGDKGVVGERVEEVKGTLGVDVETRESSVRGEPRRHMTGRAEIVA